MSVIYAQFGSCRRACQKAAADRIINEMISSLMAYDETWHFDDINLARLCAEHAGAKRREFRMIQGGQRVDGAAASRHLVLASQGRVLW
jgi:hypothetical protein